MRENHISDWVPMIILNVPYVEKDQARELGAHWDASIKKWYVPLKSLAPGLERWIPADDDGSVRAKFNKQMARIAAVPKKPKVRRKTPLPARGHYEIDGDAYVPQGDATGLPWA